MTLIIDLTPDLLIVLYTAGTIHPTRGGVHDLLLSRPRSDFVGSSLGFVYVDREGKNTMNGKQQHDHKRESIVKTIALTMRTLVEPKRRGITFETTSRRHIIISDYFLVPPFPFSIASGIVRMLLIIAYTSALLITNF
eukprot:scaffold10813_cov44-Cylindrotheca_fusiformis.AAC.1